MRILSSFIQHCGQLCSFLQYLLFSAMFKLVVHSLLAMLAVTAIGIGNVLRIANTTIMCKMLFICEPEAMVDCLGTIVGSYFFLHVCAELF